MFGEQLEKAISCPYCGERISILIDTSVPEQHTIEDCSVCCRPIELQIFVTDGEAFVQASTDTE